MTLGVRVTGAEADEHRLAVNDLIAIGGVLQTALRNVASVLSGGRGGLGGRKAKGIEGVTELYLLAAPARGSVALDFGLVAEEEGLPGLDGRDLGGQAAVALVSGMAALKASTTDLPRGFDPGVLRVVERFGPVIRKDHIISFNATDASGAKIQRASATIDRHWLTNLDRISQKPLRAHVSIEGTLQMVDLAADPLQCRIDRSFLPKVSCLIAFERRTQVRALIGRLVQVSGEGQFERGSDQPKRVVVESFEAIKEVAGIDPRSIHDHMTWQELAAQQGVGPLSDPGELSGVFEDDDELDAFLGQLRPGQDLAF